MAGKVSKSNKLSPMMAQYFEVKEQYPDTILFFRVGDFYEMFFDDAKTASSELDLVLTGKDCGQEERAPMCGVPFHSADNYIAKLVGRGYKVAICEQVEDPSKATGLVKRDVIRIITPGTVIESNMLEDGANNYLCTLNHTVGNTRKLGNFNTKALVSAALNDFAKKCYIIATLFNRYGIILNTVKKPLHNRKFVVVSCKK